MSDTDRIEKRVTLRAPRERVWRAIADSREFGAWFRVDLEGPLGFRLEDAAGGTLVTIVESSFDRLPLARRAEAFRMNDQGWAEQARNVERHVAQG